MFMLASLTSFYIEAASLGEQSANRKLLIHNARWGALGRVKELLKNKASIDCQDYDKKTALMYAAGNNHIEVLQFLLQRQADPLIQDNNLNIAFDYALNNKNLFAADILRAHNLRSFS